MLNNFRNLNSLYESLGARWLIFRVGYALRMRSGLIRKQIPAYKWEDRPLETWLKKNIPATPETYAQWRKQNSPQFFFTPLRAERSRGDSGGVVAARIPEAAPWNPQLAVQEAERILNGELKYFAHEFVKTGFPPDWHKDPVSGNKVDDSRHWSQISNEGEVDIKFIWEASRFSMIYPLVRAYASTRDEKFAEGFWELVQAWGESNPPNTGPNWMDGQEVALRVMAWTFGFYAFMDSPSTTPERAAQFAVMVAAHAERIQKNIGYAISTRSNHTISEAFGLWLVGLLFPELRNAENYFALGRRLLEQEAASQIFPDGSYSMYSLNYHRFILHMYLYAIRLGEINQSPFPNLIFDRISASIDYLSQLIDPDTGQMPFYGSNDGALVLPLNDCDFTDFRPLVQLGSYLLKKQFLFEPGPWDEDIYWLCGENSLSQRESVRVMQNPRSSFPDGGTYILRGADSKAVIRCTHFRSRPSHADQLHVDLWWRGSNIACDAGTYLYSGDGVWRNGLARTSVHNTVIVDRQDQMNMLSRFTWTNWAQGKVLRHEQEIWQGEHDGYQKLPDPVHHKRTVLSLDNDRWLVVDHLTGRQPHHYALQWLLNDFPYEQEASSVILSMDPTHYKIQIGLMEGQAAFSLVRGDENSTRGWRSRYYGHREPAISIRLEADQPRACFWTFFGMSSDNVEPMGRDLQIGFDDIQVSISLDSPQL